MSSREEFEAWYKRKIWPHATFSKGPSGVYDSGECQGRWRAWEASREALVVEIPSRSDRKYMEYFPDVEGGCFNERAYLADLQAAIEAAGVMVKP